MQKALIAVALATALGMGGHAYAADISSGGMKDAPAAPVYSWTGFYAGANAGYSWGSRDQLSDSIQSVWTGNQYSDRTGLDPEGGFGGGQMGYNWQRDHVVFGIEADFQGSDITASRSTFASSLSGDHTVTASHDGSVDWFGTVRGRLGVTVFDGAGLAYVTGGYAYGGLSGSGTLAGCAYGNCRSASASSSETRDGYALGGGLEYFLNPRLSFKLEYQWIDFGSETYTASSGVVGGHIYSSNLHLDDSGSSARIGLNYHFTPDYQPLK